MYEKIQTTKKSFLRKLGRQNSAKNRTRLDSSCRNFVVSKMGVTATRGKDETSKKKIGLREVSGQKGFEKKPLLCRLKQVGYLYAKWFTEFIKTPSQKKQSSQHLTEIIIIFKLIQEQYAGPTPLAGVKRNRS